MGMMLMIAKCKMKNVRWNIKIQKQATDFITTDFVD